MVTKATTTSTWEEREKALSVGLGESLYNAEVLEEAVQARLRDPLLSPKSRAGLKQILITAQRLQRTLR